MPNEALVDRDLLAQLGYTEWADAADTSRSGVTILDASRVSSGLNLFKSDPRHEALLMDMDGQIVHRWRQPEQDQGKWHHIELLPDGSLIGIVKTAYVERIAWDGRRLWKTALNGHHDLDVDEDGRVFVLIEGVRRVPLQGEELPIVDQGIAILDANGALQRELWLSPLLSERLPAERIEAIREHLAEYPERIHRKVKVMDVFHVNSLELLRADLPGIASKGDLLLSIRELDLIAILDLEAFRFVWTWGPGILDRQHQPSLLPDGHLLIFDNGRQRGWSRVIEVDPASGELIWEYQSDPPEAFYSDTRGGAERLPGGNTLMTDSNDGRAIEVTADGTVVWSFLNPDVDEGRRATIYRLSRLSALALDPSLLRDG